jgi:hypothetical protein
MISINSAVIFMELFFVKIYFWPFIKFKNKDIFLIYLIIIFIIFILKSIFSNNCHNIIY